MWTANSPGATQFRLERATGYDPSESEFEFITNVAGYPDGQAGDSYYYGDGALEQLTWYTYRLVQINGTLESEPDYATELTFPEEDPPPPSYQGELIVDANRDGGISSAQDNTTEQQPYRFWLNNDHDNFTGDTYDPDYDHPWPTPRTRDNSNHYIEQERDLEDLTRMHISISGMHADLVSGNVTVSLKWAQTLEGQPGIRVFRAFENDGGNKYLSDPSTAASQMMGNHRNELGIVHGATTCDLPVSFWAGLSQQNRTKYLLFEGLAEGKGELTIVFKRGTAEIAQGGSVFLELIDIRKMYERWKIDDNAVIDGPDIPSPTVSGVTVVDDPFDHPFVPAWDEDTDNKSYLVCVHGWRKTYYNARSEEITIYKRLWHRGFRGRYVGFYWPTYTGAPIPAKYNHSEYRAWKCGPAFKDLIENRLPADYSKNIIAHSMGNVVVGGALNQGMGVNRYALLNVAVPAQCYDADPALRQPPAQQTYLGISYNAWAGPDLGDDPLQSLQDMAYRGTISAVNGTLINFFLSNDEATRDAWEANQWNVGGLGKPVTGYDYDVGVKIEFAAAGATRVVTDGHEAMAMVNQSMTKAVGAEGRTGGSIGSAVDLNGPGISFGNHQDAKHQAIFEFRSDKTWQFYESLMRNLEYTPTVP
ncbi:MAG: alpha/beta hydrolase [Verrucomicrobiota bacterium]|nr:alpha/beta hydrolase [Verrucomicrobiota bacterium]